MPVSSAGFRFDARNGRAGASASGARDVKTLMRNIALRRVELAYQGGLVLHTASSGAVPVLDELRLVVTENGAIAGLGATRVNIAYLSGIDPETLVAACIEVASAIPWANGWEAVVPALDAMVPALAPPVRMLFEMAAADARARVAALPLSVWLGGAETASTMTNQTLFRSGDDELLERAEAYVARGFTDLKLRIGFGDFADDLRRLRGLRARFGTAIKLSADANGSWTEADAPARLAALAALDIAYIEQPLPAADWAGTARLAAAAKVPIMLDESLADEASADRLAETRAAPLAHLKLAKLGGLDRLMNAGRSLTAAGIGVMVGQMNEGSVSTLAAAHAAVALEAPWRELYGADALESDPAGLPRYAEGRLHLPRGPGIGLTHHQPAGPLLWELTI